MYFLLFGQNKKCARGHIFRENFLNLRIESNNQRKKKSDSGSVLTLFHTCLKIRLSVLDYTYTYSIKKIP